MSSQKIEDRAYLQKKVDDILKPMLTKMFVQNPSDPVSLIICLLKVLAFLLLYF